MPESPKVQVVALYARVSTEEQREGQNIDSQLAEIERFAVSNQWPIAEKYKDEGWSGGVIARPELDRLRDDASKGRFQAVLVNDVDRLARDVTHLGIIRRDLARHGIQLIFRKLPSSNSPTHDLMVNILGSFAEFERALIADRTRRGKRYKVEVLKQYVGSHPPFGYRYFLGDKRAGKTGYLEVDPVEALIVQRMFEWVDEEGLSARRVLLRLNETSFRPRNGMTWGKSSVNRILRNETYAGVWHFGKHQGIEPVTVARAGKYRRFAKSSLRLKPREEWLAVPLPDHLRIVDRDVWLRVQRRIDQNICFSPRNQKHNYLLKGLLRCGACEGPFVGEPCHGKFYYRCGKRCRQRPTRPEPVLNDVVWKAVVKAILNPTLIAAQVVEQRKEFENRHSPSETETSEIETGLARIGHEESRLLEAYRLEIISADQLNRELSKLKSRKQSLIERKANAATELEKPRPEFVQRSIVEYCEQVAGRIRSLDFGRRQELLRSLIRKIIIEPNSVRICAEIPCGARRDDEKAENVAKEPRNDGRIATTTTGRFCSKNPLKTGGLAHYVLCEAIPEVPRQLGVKGPNGKFIGRAVFLRQLINVLLGRATTLAKTPLTRA